MSGQDNAFARMEARIANLEALVVAQGQTIAAQTVLIATAQQQFLALLSKFGETLDTLPGEKPLADAKPTGRKAN